LLDKIKRTGLRILQSVRGVLEKYLEERWGPIVDAIVLIRARREEDISVSYAGVAGCLIAGIIMALAKPLVSFITGIDVDNPDISGLPSQVTEMMGRLLSLIRYLGVVLVVIGLIWAGMNLRRRLKNQEKPQSGLACDS